MGWDASRPVPWRRLVKEWLIYAAILAVTFALLFRDRENVVAIVGGLVISGPLYLALGYVLAKFGYQRKTLAELRTPRAASVNATPPDARPSPTPTRRTAGGANRRPAPTRRSRKRR